MTAPRVPDHVDSRDVDGEVVVWDGASLHLLDPTAAAVWRLIDGTRTDIDLVAALAEEFPEVERSRLESDVDAELRYLAERGLGVADPAAAD